MNKLPEWLEAKRGELYPSDPDPRFLTNEHQREGFNACAELLLAEVKPTVEFYGDEKSYDDESTGCWNTLMGWHDTGEKARELKAKMGWDNGTET